MPSLLLDNIMCHTQRTNGTEVIAANPDDFGAEMFRRDTSGAAGCAGSSADNGVDTWLACSAATGACADRCKRARPGPYTPVADTSSRPPSGGAIGLGSNAADTRSPAPVFDLNAAGPSGATAPALSPAVTLSHGCYVNVPASPIDLTGHDEAGSPAWHVVPPPLPPRCSDRGPSPHDTAHVSVPGALLGTVAGPQVVSSLHSARLQAPIRQTPARLD